ncbi:hypothetical protein CEUSTIGMA_g7643.t1 [Chlamydomonas eustigma]|uniref:Glycosyl transferase family 1 domain-containing protein n=1 Tax=Chlamydomonas eustigma TaxID=1157962 RepID=A0A250XAS2_9CHLO|nr:hypothetical protein CEUSTIGMA_g7643.t1 [Chlamydomonas eustigma]|eukprot:GAX80205.1 hypothetical protein CEUSTIGMA_g7643.t1 [Chlamydomonas eustigma]
MHRRCWMLHSLLLSQILLYGLPTIFGQVKEMRIVQAESEPLSPSISLESCPQMRIAVINGVNFHFEVLAGILHVLKPFEGRIEVFLSPWIQKENYDGVSDLISWSKAKVRSTNGNHQSLRKVYGLAILISTDYEVVQNQRLLNMLQPASTIAVVHNSDYKNMPSLLNLSSNLALVTLSPHVAESLSKVTGKTVQWLLPVYPLRPDPDCTASLGSSTLSKMDPNCLKGFSMQGKFSNLRRNYSDMWKQILEHAPDIQSDTTVGGLFHMNVLGKGPDRLNLPPQLQNLVSVHRRLPFQSFYTVICHTLALIPSLASQNYFTSKFSSTIITSLSTGTPIIASNRLMRAYHFLKPDTVYVQSNGEEEIDVMLKITRMTSEELLQTRKRLRGLSEELNKRTLDVIEGYLHKACQAAL